ncbi:MAG: helix-turn-helix domain-containing protein [Anaerolineales bacterium]|nr:helix-turn-helix domain-containing protein [Anaerolineales bacterium]
MSDILCFLIEAKGTICDPETLIRASYPSNEDPNYLMKTFYQQIGNLKKRLEDIAPGWLQNVRGKGYRLVKPDSETGDVKS